jgi:hypothetical protein
MKGYNFAPMRGTIIKISGYNEVMSQWYILEDDGDDSGDIKRNGNNTFDPYWDTVGGADENDDIKNNGKYNHKSYWDKI